MAMFICLLCIYIIISGLHHSLRVRSVTSSQQPAGWPILSHSEPYWLLQPKHSEPYNKIGSTHVLYNFSFADVQIHDLHKTACPYMLVHGRMRKSTASKDICVTPSVLWKAVSCKQVMWGAPVPFPSPTLPLEVGPLIAARGYGGALKLPSGSGQSPAAKCYLVHFRLKKCFWYEQF